MAGVVLGRVVESEQGLRWRYAYDLLRWFRFLHDRWTAWERAERSDVREFVDMLHEARCRSG